jgi:hypothetical protein
LQVVVEVALRQAVDLLVVVEVEDIELLLELLAVVQPQNQH